MAIVYRSAKDAFSEVLEDRKNRTEKGMAVYGTGSTMLTIITDSRGERPNCAKFGPISESDVTDGITGNGIGAFEGRDYRLVESENYPELLSKATKDDLYLFASIASPVVLNDESTKTSFYNRLTVVQNIEIAKSLNDKERCGELMQEHSDEKAQFDELFGLVEDLVLVDKGRFQTFYPKGYGETQPEENQPTEA